MARIKSSSTVTEKAQTRLASLSSIDPALDLGNGLTIAAYKAAINDTQSKLSAYNALLSQADEAAKFGKDSNEYEMAGGARKSEIKRPAKKKSAA